MADFTAVNPSSALARVLVDELVRGGVRDVVPQPRLALGAAGLRPARRRAGRRACGCTSGSTSAPPASSPSGWRRGRDARSRSSRRRGPRSPTCTPPCSRPTTRPCRSSSSAPTGRTSSGGPARTRRPSSRGSSAARVRWSFDLPAPGRASRPRAVLAQHGLPRPRRRDRGRRAAAGPGPPRRLLPRAARPRRRRPDAADDTGTADWPDSLDGRADGAPWVRVDPTARTSVTPIEEVARTLVVIGSTSDPSVASDAVAWAAERGHPVVAEPFGLAQVREARPAPRSAPPHRDAAGSTAHVPDRVVVVGRVTLSRAVGALLRRPGLRVEVVSEGGAWPDPSHVAAAVHAVDALRAPVDLDAARPRRRRPVGRRVGLCRNRAREGGRGGAGRLAERPRGRRDPRRGAARAGRPRRRLLEPGARPRPRRRHLGRGRRRREPRPRRHRRDRLDRGRRRPRAGPASRSTR